MIKRYSNEIISSIWTDEEKFKSWLLVEILALKAYAKINKKITKKDIENIEKKAKINVKRILEIEKSTKHDVVAFTRSISEMLGHEKKWIHYGLTSTDVVDTALSYRIKQSNLLIEKLLFNLAETLKKLAAKYMNTFQMGRTHGIHAEVTTFGYKLALWYEEINRNIARFKLARKQIEVGKISGAVGNYANVPIDVCEFVCDNLGLGVEVISTQTLQRDRHANYIFNLSLICSSLEKFSVELRHLQRTEVDEVQENFSKKQKGSSAMPHKKNPISSENISGLARLVKGYVFTSMENIPLWHERDISHSSNERIIIPDAIITTYYVLTKFTNLIENLKVNKEKMLENINITNNVVFSQKVLLFLINEKGMSRESAYDIVQPLAFYALKNKKDFKNILKKEKVLSTEEVSLIFNLENYTKNIKKIFKKRNIIN